MLDNCTYNKIKLIHGLSNNLWYMKQICEKDIKACKEAECKKSFTQLQKKLDEAIEIMKKSL